jgi:hypothetical protein
MMLPLQQSLGLDGRVARAMVLLRHDTPDHKHHFDWMIAGPAVPQSLPALAEHEGLTEPLLITFRLPLSLDCLGVGDSIEIERLADHRYAYLSYQGPISGDRGSVARVAAGWLDRVQSLAEDQIECQISWTERQNGPLQQILRLDHSSKSDYRLAVISQSCNHRSQCMCKQ